MAASWVKETQENLSCMKHYLKTDFKLHVTLENECADHCRAFALSDVKSEFKRKCLREHNITSDRCEMVKNTLSEIKTSVASKNVKCRWVNASLLIFLFEANCFLESIQ